jgi:hypothetical protein
VLANRPLFATRADEALFVATPASAALFEAVELGRNVLVEGARGSGKTTALHMLQLRLRRRSRPVLYVTLAQAETLEHAALALYRAAVDIGWVTETDNELVTAALTQRDPFVANQLIRALTAVPSGAVILVDEVGGDVGHRLFGRLRDELWQLEGIWTVAAESSQAPALLRPPADAFFEVKIKLDAFEVAGAVEMLKRRDTPLPETDLMVLAREAATPRQLIDVARRAVDGGMDPRAIARGRERRRLRAEQVGGRPAATLVAELENLGAVSAGDEDLLARMGWTRPRAASLLRQLEAAGIVEARREQRRGPGQPRKVYELRDPLLFAEKDDERP